MKTPEELFEGIIQPEPNYHKATMTFGQFEQALTEHDAEIIKMIDKMINNDDYKGKYKYYTNGWNKALIKLKEKLKWDTD